MGVFNLKEWITLTFPSTVHFVSKAAQFDHVLIEVNPLLHKLCGNAHSQEEVLLGLLERLDQLLAFCSPKKTVFLCTDGCAPQAKLPLQRRRRAEKVVKPSQFGSYNITAGSDFMNLAEQYMDYFCSRYIIDHQEAKLRFYLSGSRIPGEGELKLVKHIRHLMNKAPNEVRNHSFCLVGSDSDLILSAMASQVPNIVVLEYGSNMCYSVCHICYSWIYLGNSADIQTSANVEASGSDIHDRLSTLLRQGSACLAKLQKSSTSSQKQDFNEDSDDLDSGADESENLGFILPQFLPGIRSDFIFLCLLRGNDYLFPVPGLNFTELWNAYQEQQEKWTVKIKEPQFIVFQRGHSLHINKDFFIQILKGVSKPSPRLSLSSGTIKSYLECLLWLTVGFLTGDCPQYSFTTFPATSAPTASELLLYLLKSNETFSFCIQSTTKSNLPLSPLVNYTLLLPPSAIPSHLPLPIKQVVTGNMAPQELKEVMKTCFGQTSTSDYIPIKEVKKLFSYADLQCSTEEDFAFRAKYFKDGKANATEIRVKSPHSLLPPCVGHLISGFCKPLPPYLLEQRYAGDITLVFSFPFEEFKSTKKVQVSGKQGNMSNETCESESTRTQKGKQGWQKKTKHEIEKLSVKKRRGLSQVPGASKKQRLLSKGIAVRKSVSSVLCGEFDSD